MSSTHNFPPPSSNVINLAYVEIVLSAIFLPLVGFIAWKHGKAGMTCWHIFITTFIAMLVANIYLLIKKDEPYLPNSVSTMTDSAVIATTSLAIIGIIYEANIILPQQPKKWTEKIILGVTHLANTGGIAIATYGGAPSATGRGGVANQELSRIGNLLMLFVLFTVCGWMWPTHKKTTHHLARRHPNARAAQLLLWGGIAAMPVWLGRLAYMCVYAFNRQDISLDPGAGSFAVKMLLFGTLWGAASALAAGGWASLAHMPAGGFLGARGGGRFVVADDDEVGLSRQGSGPDGVEMYGHLVSSKR
ncbi:hypothetical protein KVR01_005905 [Diaporthe batatas]|uniref:uncharacterized protein n=1 Tax=Diaporthe batatas TaxID=748121 RepID=UPI001D058011|nr:uncharacterized protein KVR01_005905 [Diaporthe batatas]KAG8163987.1 hypothetical protein KVR01_005905 [Diaporthe batatas]